MTKLPEQDAPQVAAPPPPVVRIPGKMMLSGEYAVLREGSAVMLPVPRWLKVRAQPFTPSSSDTLVADHPVAAAFQPPDKTATGMSPLQESPVLTAARRVYLPEVSFHEQQRGEPQFSIDAGEFSTVDAQGAAHKLGLGSSAAEAVGVVALRHACAGIDWTARRDVVCRAALDAHERAQGGIGSGADVAACAYGTPLRFCRVLGEIELRPIPAPPPPARVPMALVWSGTAADSRRQVERYLAWRSLAGLEGRNAEAYLQREADQLAELWFTADRQTLFDALEVFCQAMQAIADEAELTWRLPVHARLDAWARRYGGRAKPTGAGGGDMVLLLGELPLDKLGLYTIQLDYGWLWPGPEAPEGNSHPSS